MEAGCRGEFAQRFVKSWEDGGRKFKLECRANEAGRFLLCSVVDSDAKRHCLVFPEGRGFLGGWTFLAEKLRSLGISTCDEPSEVFASSKTENKDGDSKGKKENSYVEAVKTRGVSRVRRLGEAAWLQLGKEDVSRGKELLDRCLVGRWGEALVSVPNLCALESWGKNHWKPKGGVKLARMGGPFILFEFEKKAEADKVLLRGFRCFKDSILHLERWDPKVGCSQSCKQLKKVWVRVMGLPLHLWSREVFKKIGNCCEGFVAVDESTVAFKELQWARILVKSEGLEWPSSLQVVIGTTCFAIQLWWEVLPRVSEVFPVTRNGSGNEQEVREEEGGASRAGYVVEQMQSTEQPAKVAVSSEDGEKRCRKDIEAFFSDLMPTRGAEADTSKRR